jgi:hypothetical protein
MMKNFNGELKAFVESCKNKSVAARQLGISPQQINDYLSGRRDVGHKMLDRIQQAIASNDTHTAKQTPDPNIVRRAMAERLISAKHVEYSEEEGKVVITIYK